MRTKTRLCEIMRTVNPYLYPDAAYMMKRIADAVEHGAATTDVVNDLIWLTKIHGSEYIRALAAEASHHLGVQP